MPHYGMSVRRPTRPPQPGRGEAGRRRPAAQQPYAYEPPSFTAQMARKDVRLIIKDAKRHGVMAERGAALRRGDRA
jgi:hypothetical protein